MAALIRCAGCGHLWFDAIQGRCRWCHGEVAAVPVRCGECGDTGFTIDQDTGRTVPCPHPEVAA